MAFDRISENGLLKYIGIVSHKSDGATYGFFMRSQVLSIKGCRVSTKCQYTLEYLIENLLDYLFGNLQRKAEIALFIEFLTAISMP